MYAVAIMLQNSGKISLTLSIYGLGPLKSHFHKIFREVLPSDRSDDKRFLYNDQGKSMQDHGRHGLELLLAVGLSHEMLSR